MRVSRPKECRECGAGRDSDTKFVKRCNLCVPCHKINSRKYREKFPDRCKVYADRSGQKQSVKDYRADWARSKKYGLPLGRVSEMLTEQEGKCAICETTLTDVHDRYMAPSNKMHVDHNHATGKVRELLCKSCNSGIGNFKEDPERLNAAIEYLRKHA